MKIVLRDRVAANHLTPKQCWPAAAIRCKPLQTRRSPHRTGHHHQTGHNHPDRTKKIGDWVEKLAK